MDSAPRAARNFHRWLVCLVAAAGVGLLLPARAATAAMAADVGALNVSGPSAPIAFNASFSMSINFANSGTATIVDPDIALYVAAKNADGGHLPLAAEAVTVIAPSIPMYKWNPTGTQVAVKFFPDLHTDLAPGWNSNYILTVAIAMPAGTATLALDVRAWKSDSPATVYATRSRPVTVNPAPSPTTSSPTPRPHTSTPAPAPSSPAPTESSPEPTETAEPTASSSPQGSQEAIVTVAEPVSGGTGLSPWMLLGALMIVLAAVMLVWTVRRWGARDAEGQRYR